MISRSVRRSPVCISNNCLFNCVRLAANGTKHISLELPFYTEYQRNSFVYRAHPLYRSQYPYYDWVHVQWWDGEDLVTGEPKHLSIIGHILLFFRHPDGSLMAVIHSVNWKQHEQHGVFGTLWELEYEGPMHARRPKLEIANVDALENHVCMIPYSDAHPSMWIQIWNQDKWPGCFQTIEPPSN